ncbi:transcriptional regulator [Lacticaseibacillus chiayiensis]|uniref:Helix-turn-helix domain-containing protein n=1 Tax=Lacticaseibacillus chiayiensis TaxID=2100821 RepID=A0A4Q1TR04_9LACO|nr:helix-turn-helix transcriptional regulator [Lacticaseibacillus chiayiensis]QVI34200.1 helix-turn-helix transcriptional regulator [Lacticaseibacillus chiayiensis]RXT20873.1 transcriptional regulator [Lacticaseibacillus chiayiensis]UYN55980.1 helix-turn-helix domain-containing protein [Lacticaseibacillus chiayiensis]
MQLSDKLKLARQKQHLTQTQVAEQLHVSAKTISSWENARSFPDVGTLVCISDFYNISLDQLLREDQNMMEHYETISKQSQRDNRYFQVTYYLNVVLILGILAVKNFPSDTRQLSGWLAIALIINLVILATHYPNYHAWIDSFSHKLLLTVLGIGLGFVLIFIGVEGSMTLHISKSISDEAAYLIGYYSGLLVKPVAETFSIIFVIFGFTELKEKP